VLLFVLAGVVVFAVGYFVWAELFVLKEGESVASLIGTERATPATPPAQVEPEIEPAKPVVTKPAASASTNYEKALNEYRAKGAYFQFVNCAGNPGTLTLKRGTVFMLDNRDSKAHTIKVGKLSYKLAGYGYKLVNPQTLGLNQITCDGGGAAVVNVQR
jgi:hypothetical protein